MHCNEFENLDTDAMEMFLSGSLPHEFKCCIAMSLAVITYNMPVHGMHARPLLSLETNKKVSIVLQVRHGFFQDWTSFGVDCTPRC